MSFQYKYLKYKNKYLDLKNEITQKGGSNTNTSIIQKKCNNCQKTNSNLLACGRCKSVYYCNSTCQNADWSTHKSVCNSTKLISCIKCKKLNMNSDHGPNHDHDQIIDNFMRSERQNMDSLTNMILIAEILFNKHMTEDILTSEMNKPFNTTSQEKFESTIKLTTFIRRKIFNNIYDINDIKNFIKFYLTLLKDKNFTNSKYIRYYLILIKSLYNFIKNKFPKYTNITFQDIVFNNQIYKEFFDDIQSLNNLSKDELSILRNICIEFFCYPSSSDIKKTVISNIIKYFDQNNNEEKSDSTNSNQGKIYSTTGPLFNYESGIFLNNFLKDNRILNKSSILINLGVGNGIGFYELLTGFLEIFDRRKINEILENRIAKNKKYTTNIREMIESVNLKIKEKRDIDIYAYEKYDYIPELTKTMINIRHDSLLDFFNNIKIEIDSKRDSNIIFIIQSPPPYSGSGIEVIYCAFIINHFNRLIFENNNVYIYFTGELGNTDGILGLPNWLNDNSSLESVRTMSEIINEDDIKGRTIFRVKNSTMPNNHVDIYNKSLQYFHKSLQYFNILNTDTCIERLRGWLHNEKIMDKFGNINQDNKLTYEIYNQYIQANNSSGLSKNVIDDCLIKLGLSIPINE